MTSWKGWRAVQDRELGHLNIYKTLVVYFLISCTRMKNNNTGDIPFTRLIQISACKLVRTHTHTFIYTYTYYTEYGKTFNSTPFFLRAKLE